MTILTVLILTMTLIMTLVMAPRLYWAWSTADLLHVEGEARALRQLQGEQNGWAQLHAACGGAVVAMIWLLRSFAPEVPESACAVLALYAVTSFFYSVLESLLAQRIDRLSSTIPATAKAGAEGQ